MCVRGIGINENGIDRLYSLMSQDRFLPPNIAEFPSNEVLPSTTIADLDVYIAPGSSNSVEGLL